MTPTANRAVSLTTAVLFSALLLTGCVPNTPAAGGPQKIEVVSTDSGCEVAAAEAPSGNLVFSVTNAGNQVTEFYLLGEDRLRIVGEVENIGPGLSRDLVIAARPGSYFTVCKPGMVGEGVGQTAFTVTDSGAEVEPAGDVQQQVDAANANYAAYVRDQVAALVTGTEEFAAAYTAGDDDVARELYAPTRVHWERIETVAESFGDLDPRMDLREADLEEGQEWTGWHAIEKDLWPADAEPAFDRYSAEKRAQLAGLLVADTATLHEKVQELEFSLDQQANGAIGLLDEVATGKVTGEEEFWSHTDLWDFQANVDGARVLYLGLRDILTEKDADLVQRLDAEFADLQELLDEQRSGDGFVLYTDLDDAEVRALSDAVNALAEPLSGITATLVL
jgi:iron uptake system component EfeO